MHTALDAVISVGAVTDGLRASLARTAAVLERIPAGRWADPEDFGR